MLKQLVPQGRTHRLAPMIAGMLHYAADIAHEKFGKKVEEDSTADRLLSAYDEGFSEETDKKLLPIIRNLFQDAGVEYERTSKSGEHYSVADQVIQEFLYWYEYPWDSP